MEIEEKEELLQRLSIAEKLLTARLKEVEQDEQLEDEVRTQEGLQTRKGIKKDIIKYTLKRDNVLPHPDNYGRKIIQEEATKEKPTVAAGFIEAKPRPTFNELVENIEGNCHKDGLSAYDIKQHLNAIVLIKQSIIKNKKAENKKPQVANDNAKIVNAFDLDEMKPAYNHSELPNVGKKTMIANTMSDYKQTFKDIVHNLYTWNYQIAGINYFNYPEFMEAWQQRIPCKPEIFYLNILLELAEPHFGKDGRINGKDHFKELAKYCGDKIKELEGTTKDKNQKGEAVIETINESGNNPSKPSYLGYALLHYYWYKFSKDEYYQINQNSNRRWAKEYGIKEKDLWKKAKPMLEEEPKPTRNHISKMTYGKQYKIILPLLETVCKPAFKEVEDKLSKLKKDNPTLNI